MTTPDASAPGQPVRVRFAPAPTGFLHLGSARTALFNWLAARHLGGTFLLRVEDTDVERSRQELIDVIFEALEWLGLDWDGEPVLQSTRFGIHQEAVDRLLDAGLAYWSDAVPEGERERTGARPTTAPTVTGTWARARAAPSGSRCPRTARCPGTT